MVEMNSRYAGRCCTCGARFPEGTRIEYSRNAPRGCKARHVDCASPSARHVEPARRLNERPRQRSTYTRMSSGVELYTNANGRCIDAPCCGCCS